MRLTARNIVEKDAKKFGPSHIIFQITKTLLIINELTLVSVTAFSKEYQSLPVNIKPSSSAVLTASSCDYKSYPSTGCSDTLTTCDVATSKCICNQLTSIKVGHKCLTYRNINEPCSTSKQCDKIDGKCINTFGEVDSNIGIINHGSSPLPKPTDSTFPDTSDSSVFNPVFLLNLHTGFCQCPDGMYYNQDKKKCIKRLIGSNCTFDSSCFNKEHVYCDVQDKVCSCESGFAVDTVDDNCKSHYNLLSHVLSQLPTFDGHGRSPSYPQIASTNANDRTIILPNYNHLGDNRSWSSLVWKVAILCIVLIILMGFVSGIQKARQNENLINWSRAMEQYSESSRGRNVSTDQSVTDSAGNVIAHRILMSHAYPTITEMRVMMPPPQYTSRSDINAIERDDPPSYEEAIRMGPTNDPSNDGNQTQTTRLNNEITESTIK